MLYFDYTPNGLKISEQKDPQKESQMKLGKAYNDTLMKFVESFSNDLV